ncbi:MAG: hypothetical protein V3T17_13155 [Pseudomonadales bacterium]
MDQPLYDIYFTGQLVEGTDPDTAKANLARLFKSTPENVAKLFNGKPQALKHGVDKTEALKYKAALHKAGLLVAFKAHHATAAPAPSHVVANDHQAKQTTDVTTSTPASEEEEIDWSLAPAGSDVLKESERQHVPARDIDTSNIKMVSAFVDLEPEPKKIPPAPDTSHLSAAAVGEDLLIDKPEVPPPLPLDIDNITLAPPGTELEEIRDDLPPLDPDTSALSIAAVGVDILEGEKKAPPPPAPKTDHITIAKE